MFQVRSRTSFLSCPLVVSSDGKQCQCLLWFCSFFYPILFVIPSAVFSLQRVVVVVRVSCQGLQPFFHYRLFPELKCSNGLYFPHDRHQVQVRQQAVRVIRVLQFEWWLCCPHTASHGRIWYYDTGRAGASNLAC